MKVESDSVEQHCASNPLAGAHSWAFDGVLPARRALYGNTYAPGCQVPMSRAKELKLSRTDAEWSKRIQSTPDGWKVMQLSSDSAGDHL